MFIDFLLFAVRFVAEMAVAAILIYLLLAGSEKVADRADAWWLVKRTEWLQRKGKWC